MKNLQILSSLVFLTIFSGCSKDDPEAKPVAVNEVIVSQKQYQLNPVNASGITGTVTFTKDGNNNTTILVELENTNTEEHPAYIRYNSASEGGPKAITLTVCTCSIGTTVVTKLDSGTPIDFEGLLKLDGHVSIQGDGIDPDVIVATADIGINAN